MNSRIRFSHLLVLSTVLAPLVQAGDWLNWGGTASRNMVSDEKGLTWDFSPGKRIKGKDAMDPSTIVNQKWTLKLGSQSYGTPVIAKGKVLVGTNNENPFDSRIKSDRGVVLCLDEKDGKPIWQFSAPKLGTGKVSDWEYLGMCNTGAIEGDRVYVATNRCSIVALDLNGLKNGNDGEFKDELKYYQDPETKLPELGDMDADILWTFDMREETGVFPHNITSSAVLVAGDRIFANTSNGQDWTHTNIPAPNAPSMICLDKNTGKLLGEEASGISKRCLHGGWSSPAYGKIKGQDVVVFGGSDGFCYGFSFQTKKNEEDIEVLEELWRIDCNPKEYRVDENGERRKYQDFNGPSEIISTPVIYKDKVYVVIGQDPEHLEGVGMMTCIDPSMRGDLTGKALWTYQDITRCIATSAIVDDVVYAADYSGRVHAVDANTGARLWLDDTKGRIWASTLAVDGRVLACNEEGELHIYKQGRTLQKEKVVNFPGPIFASPVVANGTLYVTTMSQIYAFGKN